MEQEAAAAQETKTGKPAKRAPYVCLVLLFFFFSLFTPVEPSCFLLFDLCRANSKIELQVQRCICVQST